MPSFISSQRHNIDRLLALVLLWNVIGGALVTLGAPWLAEIAGLTGLRQPTVLPTGSGWLALGVPTHFAGIWLPVLGVYALHRMRRHLQWHLVAIAFYAPQTFALTAPVHMDLWIGLFAAVSFPAAIAINWLAVALVLTHAYLGLLDSGFRVHLTRVPAAMLRHSRNLWGSAPLSRAALSRRYACIATVAAFAFLPLVPAEAFYPSSQYFRAWFERDDIIFWRLLLLLPITFATAYVVAFVWSGGQREPHFSARRGVMAALLTYVYVALAADLSSRWLTGGQEMLFRLFMVAWVYLLPLMMLIPVIGGVAGAWLRRNLAARQKIDQPRRMRLTSGMLLTLVTPLAALLLSYALGSPQRSRIETARTVAQGALASFDQNEPQRLYAMFTTESLAMIDRDSFIAILRERRDSVGALESREGLRHQWYPRAGVIQFDYSRVGTAGESNESIVIDVRGSEPAVSAVFMSFEGQPPAHNIFVPRRSCGGRNEVLHCGQFDDQPPRSLF
jgi:hypothetical protein